MTDWLIELLVEDGKWIMLLLIVALLFIFGFAAEVLG